MLTAKVVESKPDGLHGGMMLKALAVGVGEACKPFDLHAELLIERFDMACANNNPKMPVLESQEDILAFLVAILLQMVGSEPYVSSWEEFECQNC